MVPIEKFKIWDFLQKCQKPAIFDKNQFLGFCRITQSLALFLAEFFLKSYPKCFLGCVSGVTCGKIEKIRIFGQNCQKIVIFAKSSQNSLLSALKVLV